MNAGLLDSRFRGNDGQSARIAHGNFGKALREGSTGIDNGVETR